MYRDISQIRNEINAITIGFVWDPNPGAPEKIADKNLLLKSLNEQRKLRPLTTEEAERYQKEIVSEYCWLAYQKSLSSQGDMVVGRQTDLARQGLYEKVAELVRAEVGPQPKDYKPGSPNLTFLDDSVQGNLLNQDKWAGPVNDAWILGGIHRKAKFRLTSPRIMENLWNVGGYLVVTAREIIGLLYFGYELHQIGPWQVFLLKQENERKAMGATLTEYEAIVRTQGTIACVTELIQIQAKSAARPAWAP